jgi:hypothetical protein
MKFLRKIPQDMTYRQDDLGSIVKDFYKKSKAPTSTDSKTATDRIPVSVTSRILSKI